MSLRVPISPRLTLGQRHCKLFNELDLSGLDSWAPKLVDAAHWLRAKYHDVFSLNPGRVGLYPFHGKHDKSNR